MAALSVVSIRPVTAGPLYEIEEQLAAMFEILEETPAQDEEFFENLASALLAETAKCDSYERYLRHCETQIAFAKAERDRLKERAATFDRALERAKKYLVRVVQSLGTDAKGKYKRLEGSIVRFRIQGCADSVTITDEALVPARFKTITVKMPATVWMQLLELVTSQEDGEWVLAQANVQETAISKTSIKADLEAKIDVPGAKLNEDQYSLRRE